LERGYWKGGIGKGVLERGTDFNLATGQRVPVFTLQLGLPFLFCSRKKEEGKEVTLSIFQVGEITPLVTTCNRLDGIIRLTRLF
jgi:hypothetical protein